MSLATYCPIGFIPTQKPEAARAFYQITLGLTLQSEDQFAAVFLIGPVHGLMLRLVRVSEFTPLPYTIFGWEVPAIEEAVRELASKGVSFLRYGFFKQDENGIWDTPEGGRVAWFHDPDGNTLSISQHPS